MHPPADHPPDQRGKKRLSEPEQARRFAETARALGCDEDKAAFDEKLKVLARQKQPTQPPTATPRRVEKHGRPKQG